MSNTHTVDTFGINVFGDKTMQERLPEAVYQAVQRTIKEGVALTADEANIFATALKEWAIERGATHYTHWFQPLTGITAEKHESFLSPTQEGDIIVKFRGKELIKGEPDASSFPNGGIRATFEARGYTAWDPTSCAFIKDNTLCIPTAFCSYSGELLDKKTPLMKSNQALNIQCLRILKLFGSDATSVISNVGAEQEYFLIDKDVFLARRDLVYTGRTLLGTKPPKGQELDDHYFGSIKKRVACFMAEVDEEMAKLGIISKTEHNEVAPAQHELAPTYNNTNTGCDHNQLTMELLKKIADKHHMACLLHEKPFAGINGSGKHNNWSMQTDTDVNLLDPGKNPRENAQFLLFLSAIIKAVDEYQDILRATVASAGNDHRLGANEAPPAVISIFVGSDLAEVIDNIVHGIPMSNATSRKMHIGVDSLPTIPKDTTDRNRTSPFAFTGNKFEFRMPGSSASIADPNTVINTIVAEALSQMADILEGASDFDSALSSLICDTLTKHERIIFNGDGYNSNWLIEAEKRGLSNLKSTADALPQLTSDKSVALFEKHNVLTSRELLARKEVLLENYCKVLHIEALTLLELCNRDILPAVHSYIGELANIAATKSAINCDISLDQDMIAKLAKLQAKAVRDITKLTRAVDKVAKLEEALQPKYYHDTIVHLMAIIRTTIDTIEGVMPREFWPLPTYGDILYSVN